MLSRSLPFREEELEYIVDKNAKKAVIIKYRDYKELMKILNVATTEKKGAAQALWNLILEQEEIKVPNHSISSHYKEHLYGQKGLLK